MLSGIRLKQKVAPISTKLHAVADQHRTAIMYLVSEGPKETGEIIDRLKITPTLAAHHLKILLNTGWITKTKYGRLVTYYLNMSAFDELKKLISRTPLELP